MSPEAAEARSEAAWDAAEPVACASADCAAAIARDADVCNICQSSFINDQRMAVLLAQQSNWLAVELCLNSDLQHQSRMPKIYLSP